MSLIPVAETVSSLRQSVAAWRAAGETVSLVPTMGALHAGHVSLVERARQEAERVVVSIFVNPTQFAPNEDFAKYPRTFDTDRMALTQAKADLIYAPRLDEMYPPGFCTSIHLEGPAKVGLEDAFRPSHFSGVASVVAKLFLQCGPDSAVFGEKDYQQLMVVTRMARDLDIPSRVIGAPTMREADGLAMSSRNRYLSAQERATAALLPKLLFDTAKRLRAGESIVSLLEAGRKTLAQAGFVLDYLEARHAGTLAPLAGGADEPIRLLVAAKLGTTRLIDNIAV